MSDGGDIPFAAIGVSELGKRLGRSIVCPMCGKSHELKDSVGTHTDANGNVTETKGTLQFYKCGDKTYLAGIHGKAMPGTSSARGGK